MTVPMKTQKRPPKPPFKSPTLNDLFEVSDAGANGEGRILIAYTKTNSQVAIYMDIKPNVARKLKFLWPIAAQSIIHSDMIGVVVL